MTQARNLTACCARSGTCVWHTCKVYARQACLAHTSQVGGYRLCQLRAAPHHCPAPRAKAARAANLTSAHSLKRSKLFTTRHILCRCSLAKWAAGLQAVQSGRRKACMACTSFTRAGYLGLCLQPGDKLTLHLASSATVRSAAASYCAERASCGQHRSIDDDVYAPLTQGRPEASP